jgi:hypothetical protein
MGNYFSSSKNESIQIINETDHDHVVVTNSSENLEKKDEHVTKTEEIIVKEDNQNDSLSSTLNEDNEGVVADADADDADLKTTTTCLGYVIKKKNLKKKQKKNKKKHHLQ